MAAYALVINDLIIQIDAANFPVAAPLTWTGDISAVSPAPQVGWTAVETAGVWAFTAPAAPPSPTLAQQAHTAMGAGLAIVSTGTPSLNATYAVDAATTAHITAEMIALLNSGGTNFADGTTSVVWPDMGGSNHTFTATEFKAFALAIGAYVAGLYKCINGTLGSLPGASATIA